MIWLLVAVALGCSPEASAAGNAEPSTFQALLALPATELAGVEIARMNLLCGQWLPGNDPADLEQSLTQLDAWAKRVRGETDRHRYRFERAPAEFEHSEGFFKLLMLGVVLAEDYGVHYRPELRSGPGSTTVKDGFFRNPRDVFLSGLLGSQRAGTCSSLPVLYVAVGRRLGYPLKLVTTKGHLFVRWEGEGERFNVEVTGQGLNRFLDEYYRHWPFALTDGEVKAEAYLESLTPTAELAVFLSVRGMCLRETGRTVGAAEAFEAAARLAPGVRSYREMASRCRDGTAGDKGMVQTIGGAR